MQSPGSRFVLFNLGFRPFFLGASAFAVASVALWFGIYHFGWPSPLAAVSAPLWHAHEMIYGYSLGVIAGFLLTAVRNWTGIQTLYGLRLSLLFSCWLLARLAPLLPGPGAVYVMAALDMVFVLGLVIALLQPIIRVRQWKQMGVISKIVLLGIANGLFYAGVFGWQPQGVDWGIFGGLYFVIALIMTMGRRVMPFFIEGGVDYPVRLKNRRWLDVSSIVLFLLFVVVDLFTGYKHVAALAALLLFVLHCLRLWGWHTPGIWKKPLLWSLYCAYGSIVLGFLLYAAGVFLPIPPSASVHAFAFGGIGTITLSMMARVSLGHTGRNIQSPPKALLYLFLIFLAGLLFRVVAPLLDRGDYSLWIAFSQVLWITVFSGFLIIYFPILTKPRLDGKFG